MPCGLPAGMSTSRRSWAEQRARLGWRPLFVLLDDDHPALVLLRPFPIVGGESAYIPRGPVVDPTRAEDGGGAAARRMAALANWLVERGVVVVATDAEVPATDAAYGAAPAPAGFDPIPEIQPSRHRVSLALARDTDDAAVRAGVHQEHPAAGRRRRARRRRSSNGTTGPAGRMSRDCSIGPRVMPEEALGAFATLLEGTGERRGFRFGPRQVFLDWWTAAHDAGHARLPRCARRGRREPLARRSDPVSPRRSPLDRPLGGRSRHTGDPSGGHAPAPLACDPAGHP